MHIYIYMSPFPWLPCTFSWAYISLFFKGTSSCFFTLMIALLPDAPSTMTPCFLLLLGHSEVSAKVPSTFIFFLRLQDPRGARGCPGQSFHCCFIHPQSPACWCNSPLPSLCQLWGLIHIARGAEKWPSGFLGKCVLLWVIQLFSPTRVITSRPWAFGVGGPQRLPIWVSTCVSWGINSWKMDSCPLLSFLQFCDSTSTSSLSFEP